MVHHRRKTCLIQATLQKTECCPRRDRLDFDDGKDTQSHLLETYSKSVSLRCPPKEPMAMPKPERALPLERGPSLMGVGFNAGASCRRRLLPAESLPSMQWDLPGLEPLSAVSRIVALISHDLRHPLTAILANAEFLTQSDLSEMERNDFYQEIRWAIERMNELVSSLLECSKGRDTLRPGVRNIVDTVERAIRMTSAR